MARKSESKFTDSVNWTKAYLLIIGLTALVVLMLVMVSLSWSQSTPHITKIAGGWGSFATQATPEPDE